MQSSSATIPYKQKCCDCKATFTTASELLRHFAHHVCERNKIDLARAIGKSETECDISLFIKKTKKRKKTLLENIFNNSNFNSAFQMPYTSGSREISDEVLDVISRPQVDLVHEIGIRAKDKVKSNVEVSLVKCDFQKRLENCITKLSVKKEVTKCTEVLSISPSNSFVQTDWESSVSCGNDFSPINFCRVTMESCDKPVYSETNKGKCKNYEKEIFRTSSRKQLLPKKIVMSDAVIDEDADDREQNSPIKLENSCREHSSPIKLENSCRKHSSPIKLENICREHSSPVKLENSCREHSSPVRLENSCSITLTMSNNSPKKKYFCHLCSRSFGWSTDLKRHILTHTGERPFKCSTCDATFTRNFLLQKHEARIHHLNGITKMKGKLDLKSSTDSGISSNIKGTSAKRKVPTKCSTQKNHLDPQANDFLNWRKFLPKETSILECNN